MCRLSLAVVSRGYALLWCTGFAVVLLWRIGSRHAGFSSCSLQTLGHGASVVVCKGLVAPGHMESFQTRD